VETGDDDDIAIKVPPVRKRKRQSDGDDPPPVRTFGGSSNQLELAIGHKAVKLFRNGSVHATGCRTHYEFIVALESVCRALTATLADEAPPARPIGYGIQMIQANFAVGCDLDLGALQLLFLEHVSFASYEPDTHPGLSVRLEGDDGCTCILFRSGKVQITGAKSPAAVARGYETVCALLDTAPPEACAVVEGYVAPASRSKHRITQFVAGYPSNAYFLCAR
jgi:TATA-box binding protein (TBP) (component of TFIID and TFIIIB)